MLSAQVQGCLNKKIQFSLLISVLSMLLSGCAMLGASSNEGTGVYHDSAFNDHNSAPKQFRPVSQSANGTLDDVYIRTQADYHFSVGEALSFEGQHLKAVEAFKMVLLYDPQSPQVHLRLAAEYVRMGMITESLEHAEIAAQKKTDYVDAYLLLGGIHSTLKLFTKAIENYQNVLKYDPSNTEAPLYLGAVYAETKKFDLALKEFNRLANNENYETPHLAYYYIGRLRTDQEGAENINLAKVAYRKAIALKPSHLESVYALSEILEKEGKSSDALKLLVQFQRDHGPSNRVAEVLAQKYLEAEDYDSALKQLEILEDASEDPIGVKLRMALVLIEKKQFPVAAEKLHDVLRQVPESDKIRFYLAAVYEEMGAADQAIENFRRIPAESPFYGEAMVHAGYLLKKQNKLDQAISVIGKAIEARDDVPQFYAIYASLLDEKGSYKDAVSLLEKGVQKFPDQVQIRFFLGTIYDRLGDKKQVVEHMTRVVEMDPNHVQGLNYLAYTYAEKDANLGEAEKLVRRALVLEPNDGYILDTLGWILFKQGKTREAVRVLEAAHRHLPTEAIIAEHLGDAYYKLQLNEKARGMYLRAFETETDTSKRQQIEAKITAIDNQQIDDSQQRRPASVVLPREANSNK